MRKSLRNLLIATFLTGAYALGVAHLPQADSQDPVACGEGKDDSKKKDEKKEERRS